MPANASDGLATSKSSGIGRRDFLAAAVGVPVLGSIRRSSRPTTIRLDGRTDGWVGRSPTSIEGQTNPTLALEPGTEYEVVWENVDGAAHNFVVEDGSGTQLVRSDIVTGQGAIQTVTFTASAEMSTYLCEVHPTSMRGTVTTSTTTTDGRELPPEQRAIPMGPTVRLEPVATGLASPVGFEAAPGGSDLVVVLDQTGVVYRLADGLADTPFLDLRDRIIEIGTGTWADYDERGLLGFAFHPDFADNGRFYVRYSAPPGESSPFGEYGHRTVISEFEVSADGTRGRPETERVVFETPIPGPVHNAGAIAFGPDDYLYVSMADGSNTNDTGAGHAEDWYDANAGGNGQDVTENLLGGILRIDVDGRDDGKGYAVPDGNPLVGREGLDEYYAWGFRNPWRLSFDANGRLFVSDAGTQRFEEVNIVEKGGNYGWNVREGSHCFDADEPDDPPADCPDSTPPDVRGGEPLRDPVIEYPHFDEFGNPVGSAAIGGHFYESGAVESLDGRYVFGDFSRSYERPAGSIFAAAPAGDGGRWSIEKLRIENGTDGRLGRFVFAFGQDASGELYVLTNETGGPNGETGTVHRIVPPRTDGRTATLSESTTNGEPTAGSGLTPGGSTDEGGASGSTTGGGADGSTDGTGERESTPVIGGNDDVVDLGVLSTAFVGALAGLSAYIVHRRKDE